MVSIAKGWKIWEINHLKCKVTESFLQITGTILWNNVQWWIIYNKTMNSVCVDSSVLNRLYWIKWVMNCHVLHLRNKGFKAITSNTYSSTVYWELNDLRLVSSDICANGFKDRSSSTSYLHDQTVRSVLQGICLLNHIKQLKTSRTLCTHTHSQRCVNARCLNPTKLWKQSYESTNKTWHCLGAQKEQLSAEIPEWDANITFCKNRCFLWAETYL